MPSTQYKDQQQQYTSTTHAAAATTAVHYNNTRSSCNNSTRQQHTQHQHLQSTYSSISATSPTNLSTYKSSTWCNNIQGNITHKSSVQANGSIKNCSLFTAAASTSPRATLSTVQCTPKELIATFTFNNRRVQNRV